MKKFISVLTCVAIVFCFCTTAFASANESSSGESTMEEILNEYHERTFEAEATDEVDRADYSVQSRSNRKTLEQETVDALVEAGYEAYNVTNENYDVLEEQLDTDFVELGLDQSCSYIIVIEDEDETAASTYTSPDTDFDSGGHGGGGGFEYVYNGVTYRMRFLTVTAGANSHLGLVNDVDIEDKLGMNSFLDIVNYSMYAVSSLGDVFGIGTICSVLSAFIPGYEPTSSDKFEYTGATNWTITYTQIYNTDYSSWKTYSGVEYVTMKYYIDHTYYDATINGYTRASDNGSYGNEYSEHYSDSTWRKRTAVLALQQGLREFDKVEEVKYKFNNKVVLTHQRWMEHWGYEP